MKRLFAAALLALPLLAAPARATGCFGFYGCLPPCKVDIGCNWKFGFQCGCAPGCGAGPWYLYWPLEAHFQTPAMCQYPYWPTPQTLPRTGLMNPNCFPPNPNPAAPAAPAPEVKPAGYDPTIQPTGYYYPTIRFDR
jgi:hypothetical protein